MYTKLLVHLSTVPIRFLFLFLAGLGEDINLLVLRRIYPVTVTAIVCAVAVVFQVKQCKRLYEHIKNDK